MSNDPNFNCRCFGHFKMLLVKITFLENLKKQIFSKKHNQNKKIFIWCGLYGHFFL